MVSPPQPFRKEQVNNSTKVNNGDRSNSFLAEIGRPAFFLPELCNDGSTGYCGIGGTADSSNVLQAVDDIPIF
jgi:hypothetical protein